MYVCTPLPHRPFPPTFRASAIRDGKHAFRSTAVAAAVGAAVVDTLGWQVDLNDYHCEVLALVLQVGLQDILFNLVLCRCSGTAALPVLLLSRCSSCVAAMLSYSSCLLADLAGIASLLYFVCHRKSLWSGCLLCNPPTAPSTAACPRSRALSCPLPVRGTSIHLYQSLLQGDCM